MIGLGAVIGAGTVLSGAQAEDSLLAGARFLVSPALVPEMIEAGRARDAMTMPGTLTPTEMVKAAELGADYIKVYPLATIGGPDFIINVRRALQHLPLVATGNVELAEIPAYLAAGVVGFGIGAPLIRPDLIERADVDGVVANAKRFLAATRRNA
ncbi:MAG: 2-dehydro-3-deoxyphosphogluconate aldolase, partial [Chloroflexota bacterium]